MPKLIVFGSARVDAYLELPTESTERLCGIDTHKCVIELSYGSKIPLDGVHFLLGGNGANVSVGVKRLGVESILVAELGEGSLANSAKMNLAKEIDTRFVTQTAGVDQGFGVVLMYQGERTILSYYSPKEPTLPVGFETCGAQWAYLTSTGELFENYYEEVYKVLSNCDVKLAFNPGGRQIKKGRNWLSKYLARTHLIFVNRQEAEKIVGMEEKSFGKEKELLKLLSDLGPEICIVTDGSMGSYVYDAENKKYLRAGVMPVDSFERTGAGDAFSSGCLAAVINGQPLEDALKQGTLDSTSVIGYVGPQPGLLRTEDLPKWHERAKSCKLEVLEF